jgi:opacity protein-like surface antigen
LLVVLSFGIASPAQDTQRFEAFGGYSFSHNTFPIFTKSNFNGWNSSSTVFVNRWLGLTADFSGAYGSQRVPVFCTPNGCYDEKFSLSSYTYLFGPHFVYRRSRYAPFTESLFGIHNPHLARGPLEPQLCQPIVGCTETGSTSTSYHKFAMALGGGLDIALSHGISIRPVEVDYLLLKEPAFRFENGNEVGYTANNNTFRYSAGVTFRFGSHLGSPK